jgi:hypothetical protein
MRADDWRAVATYPDRTAAVIAAGLLASEGVASRIASDVAIPGLGSFFEISVPAHLLRRAQQVLEQAAVPEAELADLALREPPAD